MHALIANPYRVFLAETQEIGYTPTGVPTRANQLYQITADNRLDRHHPETVLGQYQQFQAHPNTYTPSAKPSCHSALISDLLRAHISYRLDPKYHLFQAERIQNPPPNMTKEKLKKILTRREEEIRPTEYPDTEFLTLTLSQDGTLSPREAGKGQNPPSWYGAYFSTGSRWFRTYTNDLIVSQIDLWKGCVAVIPPQYNQAIVTQEFLYIVWTKKR